MDNKYHSFAGIYIFTYGAIGTLFPLIGQYLAGIGFSGVQIGLVTATATAVGIGASPFWGYRSHHSKDSTRVVIALCMIASLIIVGLAFVKLYPVFLLGYAVFFFFQAPIMPLTDAMTLENKIHFGSVRKWGSLGYAAAVFIAGQLAHITGMVIILPLCASCYTVAWIIMLRLKRHGMHGEHASEPVKKEHRNYLILLKNKKLMALLFAAFFILGTNVANNTYFGFLYRDVGGTIAGVGVAFLLMCAAEAPFMAWTGKLEKLMGMEKMILASMIISALRFLWYSTGPSPALLIGTFFLQGVVNGILLVEFIRYVAKLVEPAIIGMAMSLYQAFASSSSAILCQLVGGVILDHYGGPQVYLFFSIYNIVGIILYVGFGLYKH